MTASYRRSTAALLASSLEDASVVVDADDRVLAWNAAAETRLGVTDADAGRTLAQLSLDRRPGAVRLALAADPVDDAAAIIAWRTEPSDDDVVLQKARAMSRLARGVTHQGRNHLAGFSSFFGLLRTDEAFLANYGTSMIANLEENARIAPELLSSFAELARDRVPVPGHERLRTRLAAAMLLVEFAMDVRRDVAVPDDLPEVLADRGRLHQALVAVIVNMIEALGGRRPSGRITATATATGGDGGHPRVVRLVLEDDAPAVPKADRAHLFDRVPPPGCSPRAGLDLSVARRLIEADGGTLDYEPGPGGGNRFVVTLPCALDDGAAGREKAPPERDPEPEPAHLTVLVCDDDGAILALMVRILERAGISVVTAGSGLEALAALDRVRVDLVMSDHRMSEMSGTELHAAVAERHPRLRRRFILMSGDAGDPELTAYQASTGVRILAKPFEPLSSLPATIREAARS